MRLAARIGNDRIGALTREVLAAHSPALPEHLTEVPGEHSSYTIVLNPPGVDRTFLHCPGANDTFGPEDLDPALLSTTRSVHFGYPPLMRRMYADGGETLAELLTRIRQAGATTSLDLAMPDPTRPAGQADWPAILARALPLVDLFVPSIEELLFMLDRPAYERIIREHGPAGMIDALSPELIERLAQRALDGGARVVFIKLGHRGVYLRSAAQPVLGRGAPADAGAWAATPVVGPRLSRGRARHRGRGRRHHRGLAHGPAARPRPRGRGQHCRRRGRLQRRAARCRQRPAVLGGDATAHPGRVGAPALRAGARRWLAARCAQRHLARATGRSLPGSGRC